MGSTTATATRLSMTGVPEEGEIRLRLACDLDSEATAFLCVLARERGCSLPEVMTLVTEAGLRSLGL